MLVVDGMELSTDGVATSSLTILVTILRKTLESLGSNDFLLWVPCHTGRWSRGRPRYKKFRFPTSAANLGFRLLIHGQRLLKGIYDYEISQLCSLFRNLLASAPDDTTDFCIIDGISWFANFACRGDISTVTENLRDFVDELRRENQDGTVANLKILITGPNASRSAIEWYNPDFHMIIAKDIGGNGQISNTIAHADRLLNHQQDSVESRAVAGINGYYSGVS